MSGVEAAASLFGSEEPVTDLFADLGTNSAPFAEGAADDFFANGNASQPPAETETFPPSSYPAEHTTETVAFPDYATPATNPQATHQYEPATNGSAGLWAAQEQRSIMPEYPAAYPTQPTVAAAPASSYDSYAPSTYTHPTATTTTYSSHSAYDPPVVSPRAPTSVSTYTPYAPASQAPTSTHSYAPPVPPSAPISQPYTNTVPSIPSIPPPKPQATISRPKVSNAYDPPFIPSRRPTRPTAPVTSSYNQYQTPAQPFNTAPMVYNQYQNPPVSTEPYRPPSTTSPINTYTVHSQPNSAGSAHSSVHSPEGVLSEYNVKPASPYVPQDRSEQTSFINEQNTSHYNDANDTSNGLHEPYDPSRNGHAENGTLALEESLSPAHDIHEKETSSIDGLLSESESASPRTVPLPFSPPVQKAELGDFESNIAPNNDILYNPPPPPPQQSAYIPQQTVKKDVPVNKDPYAPRVAQSINNYIPRTSSPLSLGARSNDLRKPSATAQHLNGVAPTSYPTVLKPTVALPPPPPPVAPLKVPTNDEYAARMVPHNSLAPQDIILKGTSMQYAPSPSLVGANDPLSRTSARAPVVTFGFGGKMITCFHGMPGLNAGFDVALSSRTSSELKIHTLKKIIPATVHNMPGPSFPGPLFNDPGTSSISLVRSGQTAQTKIKKASLVTYLADRYNEIQQGLGYLSNTEKQTAEDKLILLKLLSIMVENDGRLLGTTQTDSAVRTALVPRLENLTGLQDGLSLQASYSSSSLDEAPISVTTLKPSTLDKIEELLLQGDRRQAYQFAMDQKLWAHAMIIASSIDKEAWKEVVNDFLRTELGSKEDAARGGPLVNGAHQSQNNRESLRVAYSLFSGQGPAAVQELAPVTLLQNAGRLQSLAVPLQSPPALQPPATLTAPVITPRTPNFPPMVPAVPIPAETLAKWPETAAMIISSPLTPEVSGALTALGDQLSANNWVEAAHACYLLSSQTNLLGGFNNPSTRITLLGTKNPAEALRNPDVIVYSEILEFAMSLVPPVKGQEPFHGIAHLQTYRFMRAMLLCEIGEVQLANRYCEAIASSLTQSSPYTNTALLEQLQGLQQRLSGVFHGDKSGSWIGAKISKPSLDSIGGWLEGRFTKLVTGESDSPTPTDSRSSAQPFAGPFAHYSTISTTPSGRSSPQPSVATNPNAVPPHRTASAMATSSPYSQVSIERSSSAMGYVRQPASQPTHNYGGSLSSSQSSPTGYGFNSHSRYDDTYSTSSQTKSGDGEPPAPQTGSWWGLSSEDASSTTPTAATFMKVDDSSIQASGDGFISLMDTQPIIGASHHQQTSHSSSRYTLEEEDDDLGLGNSKPRPKPVEDETTDAAKPAVAEPAKDAPTPAAEKKNEPAQQSTGGSWFGRWWKRSDPATPGPIKASLGEESAFYYDKEQKRWINKKAGAEEAAKPAAPPPPPSRAQTASPGMSGGVKPPTPVSAPPTRAASAIGLSAEPPKAPMRIRSNLAPPTESAPSTPTGTRMNATGPPPPARPKSGAAKRSVRSRYVDVFQQEAGGPAA